VVLFLISIAIVPMMQAYLPVFHATHAREEMLVFANQARGTLDRITAANFAALDNNRGDPVDLAAIFGSAAEAAKETFTLNGTSHTPSVAIVDASAGAGGLLQVRVTVGHVSLTTLKALY